MSIASFISYLSLEKNYSPHTVLAYEKDILDFKDFSTLQFGLTDIDEASYGLIRTWIISLVESGISNRSVNRKVASLKAYYKFLLGLEKLTINPLAKHKALKIPKKVEVPFSELEMERVLGQVNYGNTFKGKRDKLIIELLYATGIRRAELINLKMKDVDLDGNTIKVLGKRSKERIVPLLELVKQSFLEYEVVRNELNAIQDEAYVFLSSKGNKIYETLVYRVINRYFSEVSTKVKKSPHILRHTFATHLLNKGADLNAVKELLGHSSLASTQVYIHNSIAELKKVHFSAHPRNKKL
ncbi:Tyrosine recombinase XerC [Arenibacter antarcticus]|uniref:Tyrosine recombinase XerC n=1 Tax=Arenibacter antarcticus TaxID=2040469 RepID=A0ABW5VIS4_9FLAO|nr:tyrosine-type recombinase/integrase [Arenibacter sp. H213]MCM4169705.1 integrase [Arenibacter sp. H213]